MFNLLLEARSVARGPIRATSGAIALSLFSVWGCTPHSDANRTAAEWVLAAGGKLTVTCNGERFDVDRIGQLPSAPFLVQSIAWDIYPGDRNTQVTDNDLSHLSDLTELRELDLWAADVSDAGIAALMPLINLQRLQLSQTKITDQGLQQLEAMSQLKELGLVGTQVSPGAVRRFRRQRPQCKLIVDVVGQRSP
jgi:hypothetical protein